MNYADESCPCAVISKIHININHVIPFFDAARPLPSSPPLPPCPPHLACPPEGVRQLATFFYFYFFYGNVVFQTSCSIHTSTLPSLNHGVNLFPCFLFFHFFYFHSFIFSLFSLLFYSDLKFHTSIFSLKSWCKLFIFSSSLVILFFRFFFMVRFSFFKTLTFILTKPV